VRGSRRSGTAATRVERAAHAEIRFEQVMAPVPHPRKFFGIGYNYRAHAEEAGAAVGTFPLFFNKQTTCVSGPREDVPLPAGASNWTTKVNWHSWWDDDAAMFPSDGLPK